MGLMLLDLNDPSKVIGIHDKALLEPEMPYELEGFRGSVLFPGSMILEDDGEVYDSIEDIWPDYPTKDDFFFNEEEY